MPKGNLAQRGKIKVGDLVTYRSIDDLSQHSLQQKIIIHGVGIVVVIDDEYSKVFWLHAKQFLWVFTDKLTTFEDLSP